MLDDYFKWNIPWGARQIPRGGDVGEVSVGAEWEVSDWRPEAERRVAHRQKAMLRYHLSGMASVEDFEALVKRVIFLGFEAGKQTLEARGFRLADVENDVRALKHFLRACHQGYDKAQELIGTAVIEYEERARAEEADGRRARARRDRDAALQHFERASLLRSQQLILRRALDAILHVTLAPDEWILRHTTTLRETRNIDPEVLRRALDRARELNARSRYQFHVVVDLTTAVHLGDLVVIDVTPPGPKKWKVIELKEGQVNALLESVLNQASREDASSKGEFQAEAAFGQKGVSQFRRMGRQQRRLGELDRLRRTDQGIDPLHRVDMHVTPDTVYLRDYRSAIGRIVERATRAGVAGESIEGCLHLLAVTASELDAKGRSGVAHAFLHAANPGATCAIHDDARREEEIASLGRIQPIIDLVGHSMKSQWGIPVYVWPASARNLQTYLPDLIFGRLRVFVYFDMEAFFRLASDHGIRLSWITGREAERIKRLSERFPGSPNAWGVRAEAEGGGVQTLLSGFFARLFGHLATPGQLVELIARMPEQERWMGLDT